MPFTNSLVDLSNKYITNVPFPLCLFVLQCQCVYLEREIGGGSFLSRHGIATGCMHKCLEYVWVHVCVCMFTLMYTNGYVHVHVHTRTCACMNVSAHLAYRKQL